MGGWNMNVLYGIPGIGVMVKASDVYNTMSVEERNYYLGAMALIGLSLGYTFVKHPEILPETVKGIGEIVKGIGEVIPL